MTQSPTLSSMEKSAKVKEIIEEALESQALTNAEVVSVLHNLLDSAESDQEHIIRGMDFPPSYRVAGLLLLSFFPRLVELRHPHMWVKYTTLQEGERVKFIIETDKQHSKKIEALLEHYSQILLREVPLNVLAKDERQLMELKKILDLSALEISLGKQIEAAHLVEMSDQMESFSEEVEYLHKIVGRGIGGMKELRDIIASLVSEEQEMVNKALLLLRDRLHVNMSATDEEEVKAALLAVKEHAPDSFEEIRQVINKGSVSGAAGDMLYSWIASLSTVLPK